MTSPFAEQPESGVVAALAQAHGVVALASALFARLDTDGRYTDADALAPLFVAAGFTPTLQHQQRRAQISTREDLYRQGRSYRVIEVEAEDVIPEEHTAATLAAALVVLLRAKGHTELANIVTTTFRLTYLKDSGDPNRPNHPLTMSNMTRPTVPETEAEERDELEGESKMDANAASMRVFVSYSQENDTHKKRVTELVEDLRANGVDACFDRDVHGTPPEGWPRWMENQIATAAHVIIICTETYLRRYEQREQPGRGKGAIWEGSIIRQEMYDSASTTKKFAAVMFDPTDEIHKPQPLRPHTHYLYPRDRTGLLRWLTNQPAYLPKPLGKVPRLPPDP